MAKRPVNAKNQKNAQSEKQRLIAERRYKVADLYLKGMTLQKISIELDCAIGTVSGDLKAMQKYWLESAQADISTKMAQELAKLDKLEEQAWASYFVSLSTTQTHNGAQSKPGMKKGERAKKSTSQNITVTESAGDPRFLNIIENCIDKRCRILGIDAPGKIEITGKGGGPIEYKEKTSLAISTLAEMIKNNKISLQDSEEDDQE